MAVVRESVTDETVLIEAAQEGDVRAFERLYRLYVGRVYALCVRMAANAVEAEELAQEAFVRAWEKLNLFRGDSAFSTWLYRLAINVVVTRYRKELRRMDRENAAAAPELRGERGCFGPRGRSSDPGLRLDLDAAITALPAGARAVFVLHDVEGYRHEEIAEMTGIAVGTSKAHLHKARRLLREAMAQ